jgi:hypothetical protein
MVMKEVILESTVAVLKLIFESTFQTICDQDITGF